MKPEWCPQWAWEETQILCDGLYVQENDELKIDRALLEAHQRGRREGMDEAAKVADEYAADKEEQAPFEDSEDYSQRMLVYAKHVRRVAAAIRAKMEEQP